MEAILMSGRERKRLVVISQVRAGKVRLRAASELLGVSYIKLLIENPTLGATYKAFFGDIYQLDKRLLPDLDFATLFHVGEYRTEHNDKYGALTDTQMILMCADRLKPGGEIHFFTGSFAYDKSFEAAKMMMASGKFEEAPQYKTLQIFRRKT